MTMGIGTNAISAKWAGIDVNAVKQISAEILERANQKSELSQVNLTAFKRPELGVDFYNPKTSLEAQKQIALTNSQMQVQTPVSTGFLNAQAASALYAPSSIVKQVEGKMQPAIKEGEVENLKDVFALRRNLEVYSAQKDKRGSNGSNPFANTKGEEEQVENGLNIVA